MKYNEFLATVQNEIKKQLEPGYEVHIQTFPKNNGVVYDGLVIFHPKWNISPTIYLNPYYHWYLDGVPMEDIYANIIETYQKRLPQQDFDTSVFTDYSKAKTAIIMKLINYEHNRELLERVPHFKYLDFAVVFQCLISQQEDGFATILIHNHHLDFWSITPDELYQDALNNTPQLLPYQLENMESLLLGCMQNAPSDLPLAECPVYILTNHAKLNGATTILYDGLLHDIAQKLGHDLILLPSSIHEFLLIPVDEPDKISMFSQIVNEVNETQLSDDELLSDHAYYYSKEHKQIYMPEVVHSFCA